MIDARTRGQFLRYAVVGLASNLALYLAYLGLTMLGVGPKTAMSVLYVLGVAQTFLFNRTWSFGHDGALHGAFARYVVSYACGYVLNLAVLWIAVDRIGLPHQIVQGIMILTLAVLLFLLQKLWGISPKFHATLFNGFKTMNIPFNKPYMTGKELWYIAQAHANGHLAGDGSFTKLCSNWLESRTGANKALLTHSCTAALEMAAILADIKHGDEVIMPSYTFVSTANAFVLRGAVPVFVDIRPDTLNIDETKIEAAITEKTKAIVPVHYAGIGCEMDSIMAIARKHKLLVIEDAAQGIMSTYKGRPLGSIGHMGTLSFHETKNIISGEGGALLVNDPALAERAEIIREKGTNRSQFFRGQVDKYTWVDVGSSYLPSELIAAFLWAQMEEADEITRKRLAIWDVYHQWLEGPERAGKLHRPNLPRECVHNAHMYRVLLPDLATRTDLIRELKQHDIHAVFHYVPLHSAPTGVKHGRAHGELAVTNNVSDRLLRLPLWLGLEQYQTDVIRHILSVI